MGSTTRPTPGDEGYKRHLTPQQVEHLRFVLFAKAAESMGKRVKALESIGTEEANRCILAIKGEWVVED